MTTAKLLPCPGRCEDGRVLIDDTLPTDREPHEYTVTCNVCDGDGGLGYWECGGGCNRSFDCKDEMPAYTSPRGKYECRDCVREEAISGADFAAWARELRTTRDRLMRPSEGLERCFEMGRAAGTLLYYATKLEKLAKDLEVKS